MPSPGASHNMLLVPITLKAVPLTTHNIDWSPDAELAIATDDCVYLYVPEFPVKAKGLDPAQGSVDTQPQYRDAALRFPITEVRLPELNRPLFETVKQKFPEFEPAPGAGLTVVANVGSSINHVVALEWSPSPLGRRKRSVLGVLTGGGMLTVYCEGPSDDAGNAKTKGRNMRSVRSWMAAWGVGGNLLLPRSKDHDSPFTREYITSFSWAKDFGGNGALLAYMNDEDEIVIVTVQSKQGLPGNEYQVGQWKVEEVARFSGKGPHGRPEPTDPDFSPSGSSFSLRWSPWSQRPGCRSAMLSYITYNYVGFRQIMIKGAWKAWDSPKIEIQPFDCGGSCLYLAPDAFVAWEDLVWTKGVAKECRGIIATPFRVQSFQVTFDDTVAPETYNAHTTDECVTTYPDLDETESHSNPITGLVIHPPSILQPTPTPLFSLTRLSATAANFDWYQTNIPSPSNMEDSDSRPAWINDIINILQSTMPFSQAHQTQNPDGALDFDSDAEGSEKDSVSGELDEPLEDDDNSDEDFGEHLDEDGGKAELLQEVSDPAMGMEKIHTTRVRIWGMTCSPGGGLVAVFVTLNNMIKPERHTFAGLRCKVLFGRSLAPLDKTFLSTRKLSTEARVFEWMHADGPQVPGISSTGDTPHNGASQQNAAGRARLLETFRDIANRQVCPLCKGPLTVQERMSRCAKGHCFENCAATGVPILAPGVSNTCSVCGSRCLKPEDLTAMASDAASLVTKHVSAELCGGCGGKFGN